MSRILTIQRAARELGRLRTGTYDTSGDKPRPVRSDTWVISSHSQEYIEAAAAVWGGTPGKWQPQGNGAQQWRVITTSTTVDAILPPGDPLSQAYEKWTRGGCERRCDGITEQLSDTPCVCRAKHGDDFHEQKQGSVCNMTTRLNVMLPAMPDIGVWRAETHSFYAANELAGHVDTIRGLVGPQAMVPVRLRIEQRTRVAKGETKHFPVIALELRGITAGQVLEGGQGLLQLSGQAPRVAIEQGPPVPAVEVTPSQLLARQSSAAAIGGPGPDYVGAARAAFSLAGWREVWQTALTHGHLTDELKALLTPIGEALATAQQEAQPSPAESSGDPGELWLSIVGRCPEGWTTGQLENDFTEFTGGVTPGDATTTDLASYLEQLKVGNR